MERRGISCLFVVRFEIALDCTVEGFIFVWLRIVRIALVTLVALFRLRERESYVVRLLRMES